MTRTKRNRLVTLSKLSGQTKLTRDAKTQVIDRVRAMLDEFPRVYVVRIDNMRTICMEKLRAAMRDDSKFFFGRNKIMKVAVGSDSAGEHLTGTSELGPFLSRGVGFLFTSRAHEQVVEFFTKYEDPDFARSGFAANMDIKLGAGHLANFESSQEHQLRSLGLPVTLQRGKIVLENDFVVCRVGDVLTPEKAQILKLLAIPMANFRVEIVAWWEKETGKVQAMED